jgi:hypothetical protein
MTRPVTEFAVEYDIHRDGATWVVTVDDGGPFEAKSLLGLKQQIAVAETVGVSEVGLRVMAIDIHGETIPVLERAEANRLQRQELLMQERELAHQTRGLIGVIQEQGFSLRDASLMLGLSMSRAWQIMDGR